MNQEKKKNKKVAILLTVGVLVSGCLGFGIGSAVTKYKNNISPEMQEFITFYNYFKDHYYQQVDDRTLLDGLYYGLTSSVNDNYTFYTSTVNNEYQDLSSSGMGLGIARSVYYGRPLITQVMKNSPASDAIIFDKNGNKLNNKGLQKGDILLKAKNKNDINYYEFNKHHYNNWNTILTGEENSEIEVVFQREDKEYFGKIIRGPFNVDKVELISFDNDQAVFKINSFLGNGQETTPAEELDDYFEELIFKNKDYVLKNLVIDLRDNGGGYVQNCNQLLGLFLGIGKVAGYYQYANGNYSTLYTDTSKLSGVYNDRIENYTFIINQNTASASESFVIAMQDSPETKDKVLVVGETSFGKGIAQTFYEPFDDGSSIRYTFAKVCSPEKRSINKRGIVPDIFASYLSIQNKDEYDTYRLFIKGVNDNNKLTEKEKALIKARVELVTGIVCSDFEDSIDKIQTIYSIEENGVFGEKTASKLGDLFYDYYINNIPMNIYDSYVISNDLYDSYYPIQMKCIKEQIELILNKKYNSYIDAVEDFQITFGLEDKNGFYDLETSYLLQGKMYDLRIEKEDSVLKLAKESYGTKKI